jgi:chorismate synthase|tara:strand:+ start:1901 stop:3028 length:1128 start_codon:yes stop_codon:yes gene_type:complete
MNKQKYTILKKLTLPAMASNQLGKFLVLTTFGESHGLAIGGILDGYPAGIKIDSEAIQNQLDRRKPGQNILTTQRKEEDKIELLSGIFEGTSTGAPIAWVIINKDAKSKDYSNIKDVYRPSHADFVYQEKYGIRDYRGGGRSSARETANWVVGGALASFILRELHIVVSAYTSQIGLYKANVEIRKYSKAEVDKSIIRMPNEPESEKAEKYLTSIKKNGDTVGGAITCVVDGMPVGVGEPIFDKLNANLAKAMFSINAVKGFELGSGFNSIEMTGAEHNDEFVNEDGIVRTKTNHSGGIQGGISNGMPINFRVAFKPVATIMTSQNTIDSSKNETSLQVKGRHDPCVVPRAVPIVEALTSLIIADLLLIKKLNKL